MARLLVACMAVAATLLSAAGAAAHAEPERATPPIDGVIPAAPTAVEIWFGGAVETEGTTIQVIGPGGIQVDLGDAKVDATDPERRRVTVSLRPNLEPGTYSVQWTSQSAEDGDGAQGAYLFRVGTGSPAAMPAASPAGTTAVPTPTLSMSGMAGMAQTPSANPAVAERDFDSTAFGLSIGAGVVAALAIYGVWRVVRPKNPAFKG